MDHTNRGPVRWVRHSTPSHSRGFTLTELMVALTLIATSLAFAMPSYQDMVEKRQLSQSVERVNSFINSAQGLSSKTNEVVTVSYSRASASSWCIGMVVGTTACNCTQTSAEASDYCAVDAERSVLGSADLGDLGQLHSVSGDGAFAYDPIRGLFVDLDDSMELKLRSNSGAFRVNVQVNNTGRVTMCSDSSDHDVPGYSLCPGNGGDEEVIGFYEEEAM